MSLHLPCPRPSLKSIISTPSRYYDTEGADYILFYTTYMYSKSLAQNMGERIKDMSSSPPPPQ